MATRRDILRASAAAIPASLVGGAASAQETELRGSLTLWHGWTGAAADTLTGVILSAWAAEHPNAPVTVVPVPSDQLKARYLGESAALRGPQLLIGPHDWVPDLATGGFISPLDDLVDREILADFLPNTIAPLSVDGKLYGLPIRFETVALFYNTDLIATPPATTAKLNIIAAVQPAGVYGIALRSDFYHLAGYLLGFGAVLLDDDRNSAVNSAETVAFLTWLLGTTIKPGYVLLHDDVALSTLFTAGQAAMVIDGPWALPAFRSALGADKVGVAPLPTISEAADAPAMPFLHIEHIMLGTGLDDAQSNLAAAFMVWLTGADSTRALVTMAGHLPARTGFNRSATAVVKAFVTQAETARPVPAVPEMGEVWEPAGQMIAKVLSGAATPEEAAAEARETINARIAALRAANG